ncbi:hypothetical protein ABW19_dt0210271 [Dactylella cylindrospora]|nr:hypothetical protein ABW19_dt0210271 [Dactylella cylindrospora]
MRDGSPQGDHPDTVAPEVRASIYVLEQKALETMRNVQKMMEATSIDEEVEDGLKDEQACGSTDEDAGDPGDTDRHPPRQPTYKIGLRRTQTQSKTQKPKVANPIVGTIRLDTTGKAIATKVPRAMYDRLRKIATKRAPDAEPQDPAVSEEDLIAKWIERQLDVEMDGKVPFIDPEVKIALELIKAYTEQEIEENWKYMKDVHYHPDDLKLITIDSLPCNGFEKPSHDGPQSPTYYWTYTSRLRASIRTWIEKYILPADHKQINLSHPEVLEFLSTTVNNLNKYFDPEDFMPEQLPVGTKVPRDVWKRRRGKRLAFFLYLFHRFLNEHIWSHWLYGFDEEVEQKVMKWAQLDWTTRNTDAGHRARGSWFVENVRRKETNMNRKMLDHQVFMAGQLRSIFAPLMKLKNPHSKANLYTLEGSAEREMHMILSDAQALQLMFQSEYCYHKIHFDPPQVTLFKPEWMWNVSDVGEGEEWQIPGGPGPESGNKFISFAFEPALVIDGETEIFENVCFDF